MRAASINFGESAVTLTGVISHIIHAARDNRGASAIFQLATQGKKLVTVAEFGTLNSIPLIGEIWRVSGEHIADPTYGSQFKAVNAAKLQPDKSLPPDTLSDFLTLNSSFVGINSFWAKKLVRIFGDELFDVLNKNTAYELSKNNKLKMPRVMASNLLNGWQNVTAQSVLNTFFQSKQLPLELIETTRQLLGEDAVEHIQKNPYLLYPIMSVRAPNRHWRELDKTIRKQFNLKKSDSRRAVSYIESVLYSAYNQQGHMALPIKSVEEALAKAGIEFELINLEKYKFDYQTICINKETQTVQILGHQAIEKTVNSLLKKRLVNLDKNSQNEPMDTEQTLLKLRAIGIQFDYEQLKAFNNICNRALSIIDGCTRTGKSIIVRAAIDALIENGMNVWLISPSSHDEEIGLYVVTAESIQSFIAKSRTRNKRGVLNDSFIIVDEAQTIDFLSLFKLLKCLPVNSQICFVGDHRKLSPVGPGNMLKQMISSDSTCVTKLKHSYENQYRTSLDDFRTALSKTNGHFAIEMIPNEEFIKSKSISVYQTTETSHETLCNLMTNLWLETLERYDYKPQVVCANALLCEKINEQIQQVKFYRKNTPSFLVGEKVFYESDPVLFKKKCTFLDIPSGEFAVIHKVFKEPLIVRGRECFASISVGGEIVEMSKSDMECLSIGYAITAYKLQVKKVDHAIVLIDNYYLIDKAWIYTVATAIRESMILVGSRGHLYNAVNSAKHRTERYFGIPLSLGF